MPVSNKPIFPQLIVTPMQQILPADTTSLKTLCTAGANGTKIERITVTSTDTSAKDLQLVVTSGGTDYIIGTASIPANSGNTNALPTVSLLEHAQFVGLAGDANGNKYLYLAAGAVLKAKALSAVTTARAINIFVQGGDY